MERNTIISTVGVDNPDNRAIQAQIRRYAEGLGCRYLWIPRGGDETDMDYTDVQALIVGDDPSDIPSGDRPLPDIPLVVRSGGSWTEADQLRARKQGVELAVSKPCGEMAQAELALSLILALKRKVIRHHQQVMEGKYIRHAASAAVGSTVGILGVENGGRELAGLLAAMGCEVLVWQPESGESGAQLYGAAGLEALCRKADIVSVHLSLGKAEKCIIGHKALGWMKSTAVLISVGDSGLIDMDALCQALRDKRIEAAALDTLDRTVIEGDNPFAALRNIILTPGIGRYTREELVKSGCRAVRTANELLARAGGT